MPREEITDAFHLVGGWTDIRVQLPPDDHTAIELKFGNDPVPLLTTGRVANKNWTVYGPPPVAIFWKLASVKH